MQPAPRDHVLPESLGVVPDELERLQLYLPRKHERREPLEVEEDSSTGAEARIFSIPALVQSAAQGKHIQDQQVDSEEDQERQDVGDQFTSLALREPGHEPGAEKGWSESEEEGAEQAAFSDEESEAALARGGLLRMRCHCEARRRYGLPCAHRSYA